MKRDAAACLSDMLDYASDAADFVAGLSLSQFEADRKTQYAVLRALEVIGEAAKRVPADVQDRYPDIPWRQIIGMRNIIAHDYLGIRLSRIYATAVHFLPMLIARLPGMIQDVSV